MQDPLGDVRGNGVGSADGSVETFHYHRNRGLAVQARPRPSGFVSNDHDGGWSALFDAKTCRDAKMRATSAGGAGEEAHPSRAKLRGMGFESGRPIHWMGSTVTESRVTGWSVARTRWYTPLSNPVAAGQLVLQVVYMKLMTTMFPSPNPYRSGARYRLGRSPRHREWKAG